MTILKRRHEMFSNLNEGTVIIFMTSTERGNFQGQVIRTQFLRKKVIEQKTSLFFATETFF